jgi:hypothetical protein
VSASPAIEVPFPPEYNGVSYFPAGAGPQFPAAFACVVTTRNEGQSTAKEELAMRQWFLIVPVLFLLVMLPGLGWAQGSVVTGELIDITGELYTVKTKSDQGFDGARATFHVDPQTTEKSGDFKLGEILQAEIDPNGHAYWVKRKDAVIAPTGKK